MTKDFANYNQSLELDKFGFDEKCFSFWTAKGELYESEGYYKKGENVLGEEVLAPTFSQAFRFFEDKKRSYASILNGKMEDGAIYFYYEIVNYTGIDETRYCETPFLKREEAESACLDKLIEIAKTNVWEKQTNLNRLVD